MVLSALVTSAGCYSTKLMEFTYQELDSVKTAQRELVRQVDALTRQAEEERQGRVRAQAELNLTLQELRSLVEALSARLDDTQQLISREPRSSYVPRTRPAEPPQPVDTTRTPLPDSSEVMSFSTGDGEADRLFKASYMDLTLGDYDLAVQGFKNFLVRYPNASNREDAHYYLGESLFAMSRYLEAAAEYQAVIRDSPRSRFAPAAYLKSGFCYQRLAEKDLAAKAFRQLIALYPRSEEAEQARVALKDMGG